MRILLIILSSVCLISSACAEAVNAAIAQDKIAQAFIANLGKATGCASGKNCTGVLTQPNCIPPANSQYLPDNARNSALVCNETK